MPTSSSDPVARALERARLARTGVVIGVWRGGTNVGLWQRGDLPAGERSIFEIGSITKVFTATLLADMAREGLLGIGDRVAAHLPPTVEMPSRGREITLADLSSHRSGLPALPRGLLVPALTSKRTDPYADWDAARLEAAIPRTRPRHEPEKRFRYSNYGVGLLGYVLARRAGTSYDELVRQRIAEPLGLRDTGTTVDAGRLATPHRLSGREGSHWHLDALAGAGALRSTATDLLGFMRVHASGAHGPLAAAARETQRPRTKVGRGHIGLGWFILPPTRRTPFELLLHEGGTGGFRSFAGLAPQRDVAVVVLTNQARAVGRLGLRLLRAATTS